MEVLSLEELQALITPYVNPLHAIGSLIVITGGLVVYRLAKILALRHRRLQKIKELQKLKKTLADNLHCHENKEALDRMDEITSLTLSELIKRLQEGTLKPVDCVVAYQAKASLEDNKYNFMTTPIMEAESKAREIEDNVSKGPLYGVPISLKDSYGVEGYDSCCGLSEWIGKPWQEDCVLAKVLAKQGAIPFMKTNVPQTMYSFDCDNPIHGQTKNPCDISRTPGGSTGGEAAALASKASILGFGTDIGGSCRIPAAFCGVYGLKPSLKRISKKGCHPFCSGNQAIKGAMGPLARDVDGLAIAMRSVLVPEMFNLDPDVIPLPFQDEIYKSQKSLRIGYYVDIDAFATSPASKRAVLLAKETLERMGHELVLWEPHDVQYGCTTFYAKALVADQGKEFTNILKNDKLSPCIRVLYYALSMPTVVKQMMSWILRPFNKELSNVLNGLCGIGSVGEEWEFMSALEKWREEFVKKWKKSDLDAVICPSMGPALPIGYPPKALPLISFVCMYNLLNFTAGILPVTKVTQKDEDDMKQFPVRNRFHYFVKKGLSKGTVGLPVTIQVVTLPYKDEQCLRVMKDIETGLKL